MVAAIYLLTLLVNILTPDHPARAGESKYVFNLFLGCVASAAIFFAVVSKFKKFSPQRFSSLTEVIAIVGLVFLFWLVGLSKLDLMDGLRFPSPNLVFDVYKRDERLLLLWSVPESLGRLTQGYLLAVAIAIPAGLVCGRYKFLLDRTYPVAKILAPIPPILFVPYALDALPTLTAGTLFVIFMGAFWPIFINTMYGVFSLDPELVEAARTLGVTERRLFAKVLFPAALPSIYAGLFLGLILSFIVLMVAESIGGDYTQPGLGWYIDYFGDMFDYPRVVAGILVIALIVIVWMGVSDYIQRRLLRWQSPTGV